MDQKTKGQIDVILPEATKYPPLVPMRRKFCQSGSLLWSLRRYETQYYSCLPLAIFLPKVFSLLIACRSCRLRIDGLVGQLIGPLFGCCSRASDTWQRALFWLKLSSVSGYNLKVHHSMNWAMGGDVIVDTWTHLEVQELQKWFKIKYKNIEKNQIFFVEILRFYTVKPHLKDPDAVNNCKILDLYKSTVVRVHCSV